MTKHMDDFLDIPHEDELIDEVETKEVVETGSNNLPLISSDDTHEKEAEEIRKKALDLQDEIADIARNVEPSRSARMFEVSGQHLKLALEASNSKEKRKLEAAKLKIEAAKAGMNDGTMAGLNSGDELMVDRNALIRQMLADDKEKVVDVVPVETPTKEK